MKEYQAGVGTKAILEKHGGTKTALLRTVKRHGLSTQPGGRRRKNYSGEQIQDMRERWEGGESQGSIATSYGCSQVVVSRLLQKVGADKDVRPGAPRGSAHWSWAGGVTVTEDGYLLEKVAPDDSMFVMANRMGYVPQHRLIIARSLGRPLSRHETVHHINGQRDDNRLSNLQLRQGRHGKGIVMRCNHCGSTDVAAAEITED